MPKQVEKQAIVISPHQDDAAISLSETLKQYQVRNVLNLFTRSNSTVFDETDIDKISESRRQEENNFGLLNDIAIQNAGFQDCEVRGIAWNDTLANVDVNLLASVSDVILKMLSNIDGKFDVFIPAAFGLHPDHYLTLLTFLSKDLLNLLMRSSSHIYLYAEQPYESEKKGFHQGHQLLNSFESDRHAINSDWKAETLNLYPSQLSPERVKALSELPFELSWLVNVSQLETFLAASLRRNKVGINTQFSQKAWLKAVHDSYTDSSRDFFDFIYLDQDGVQRVIPLVLEEMEVPHLGLVRFARFAGVYVSDYFTVEGGFDSTTYEKLKLALREKNIDVIWFSNLRSEDDFGNFLSNLGQVDSNMKLANIPSVGTFCDLTFSDWMSKKSKNMRRNIKRKLEALEQRAELEKKSLEFLVKRADKHSLEKLLANQRIRAAEKKFTDFSEVREYKSFIFALEENENAFVGELKVGDQVISSLLFLQDLKHKSLAFYMQSLDAAWIDYSPSFCSIVKLIQFAHENSFLYVDFLRGNEDYKAHFIDSEFEMFKYIEVLNPTIDRASVSQFISSYEE